MPRPHLPQWPGRLTRQRAMRAGMLLLLTAASVALAASQPEDLADAWRWLRDLPARLRGWTWQARWLWPWLVALTVVALTRPRVGGGWVGRLRLVQFGVALVVVMLGLGMAGEVVPGLVGLGIAAGVGLLAAWVLVVPARLAPPLPDKALEGLSELERREKQGERARLQNELRSTPLQFIVGLAVLASAVLAFQQFAEDRAQTAADQQLTRRGQVSERFTRAIDQLGSERIETQLGGIYGLEQIARQEPDMRLAVTEVLVAYVRRRAPLRPENDSDTVGIETLVGRAPDVQAALTVLGRRHREANDPPLDLKGLDLSGADLSGADLTSADLAGADLENADLTGADLTGTYLGGAFLAGAFLDGAELRGANLNQAVLSGADLNGADLSGADLAAAVANIATTWPDGFDWHAAGVVPESKAFLGE